MKGTEADTHQTHRLERERTLFATILIKIQCNTTENTQIKWQAARIGMRPTSWPLCETNKQTNTHYTKSKNILQSWHCAITLSDQALF